MSKTRQDKPRQDGPSVLSKPCMSSSPTDGKSVPSTGSAPSGGANPWFTRSTSHLKSAPYTPLASASRAASASGGVSGTTACANVAGLFKWLQCVYPPRLQLALQSHGAARCGKRARRAHCVHAWHGAVNTRTQLRNRRDRPLTRGAPGASACWATGRDRSGRERRRGRRASSAPTVTLRWHMAVKSSPGSQPSRCAAWRAAGVGSTTQRSTPLSLCALTLTLPRCRTAPSTSMQHLRCTCVRPAQEKKRKEKEAARCRVSEENGSRTSTAL